MYILWSLNRNCLTFILKLTLLVSGEVLMGAKNMLYGKTGKMPILFLSKIQAYLHAVAHANKLHAVAHAN